MIVGERDRKMPCEGCTVQFSVFKRKRACSECERFYCSGCLRRGGGAMCAPCRVLSTRPLYRNNITHLKVRDLQCFLNRQNVSTRGCVEKEELVALCVSHVNGATYRRRGARNPGAFSSLKGFTNNINDFLNSAFEMRTGPQPPPRPPAQPQPQPRQQPQPCETRNCFNLSQSHRPAPGAPPGNCTPASQRNSLSERFTTRPGGEPDIEVPLPAESGGGAARTPSAESTRVETADCFEIEDIDDSGWEFVTRPADPLPNDSDILLSTTVGGTQRTESHQNEPPLAEPARPPLVEPSRPPHGNQSDAPRIIPGSGHSSPTYFDLIPNPERGTPPSPPDYTTLGVREPWDSWTEGGERVGVPLEQSATMVELGRARAATLLGRARALWEQRAAPRAASDLDLRSDRSARSDRSDTASLDGELLDQALNSSPANPRPRNVTLEDLKSPSELEALNVKQLKELLMRNRVEFRGCLERHELLQRATMLWNEHAQYKNEVDNIPMEECCKICMAAPLECVLLECGHIAACTACSKQLAECPICRQYVVRAVRFFRS